MENAYHYWTTDMKYLKFADDRNDILNVEKAGKSFKNSSDKIISKGTTVISNKGCNTLKEKKKNP